MSYVLYCGGEKRVHATLNITEVLFSKYFKVFKNKIRQCGGLYLQYDSVESSANLLPSKTNKKCLKKTPSHLKPLEMDLRAYSK